MVKDRNGQFISYQDDDKNSMVKQQEKILKYLYTTRTGAKILKLITRPWISTLAGKFLNTRISCLFIDSFIKSNHIDMTQYKCKKYHSYNDFFTRVIKPKYRQIAADRNVLISPGDGKITVYKITEKSEFKVKNTLYTVDSLLKNHSLANEYIDGYCVILRLTVDDYHRYCFTDNGRIISNIKISGVFHTVNPIANDYYHIYKENSREYTIIQSENFGKIIQMEVGALMVGKIANTRTSGLVQKGVEKGHFEFGGSTIILFLQKDMVCIDNDIIDNSSNNIETIVKYGEQIGVRYRKV